MQKHFPALYSAEQVRQLDREAIDGHGIKGIVLMRRAAAACVEQLLARWPDRSPVRVYCGSGNNAGDGYIIAGMLAERNIGVQVVEVGDPGKLGPDAAEARRYCKAGSAAFYTAAEAPLTPPELLVDALLGTGFKGEPRPPFATAIRLINEYAAAGLPVLAVDIPSGLDADTGLVPAVAVSAEVTVTFIGEKLGLYTGDGPDHAGEIVFADLQVPPDIYGRVPALAERLDYQREIVSLRRRSRNTHKYSFGHVVVIGGDRGMPGAVLLAGEAALRSGAGLVTVATRPEHAPLFVNRRPELMARGVENAADLEPLLDRAGVIVLGPGLGRSDWAAGLYAAASASGLPLVVDADGLWHLAKHPDNRPDRVLTPHPGEARRLLDDSLPEDRVSAVCSLQDRYGGVVLLKGAGTLVAAPEAGEQGALALNPYGNPGMATAGMGDVLSGVIGALRAQGLNPGEAARLGVVVHSLAADELAAEAGQVGLLASDLFPVIRRLLNRG